MEREHLKWSNKYSKETLTLSKSSDMREEREREEESDGDGGDSWLSDSLIPFPTISSFDKTLGTTVSSIDSKALDDK